jgi:hypothetical protein
MTVKGAACSGLIAALEKIKGAQQNFLDISFLFTDSKLTNFVGDMCLKFSRPFLI